MMRFTVFAAVAFAFLCSSCVSLKKAETVAQVTVVQPKTHGEVLQLYMAHYGSIPYGFKLEKYALYLLLGRLHVVGRGPFACPHPAIGLHAPEVACETLENVCVTISYFKHPAQMCCAPRNRGGEGGTSSHTTMQFCLRATIQAALRSDSS
jgi:hypothetical protein